MGRTFKLGFISIALSVLFSAIVIRACDSDAATPKYVITPGPVKVTPKANPKVQIESNGDIVVTKRSYSVAGTPISDAGTVDAHPNRTSLLAQLEAIKTALADQPGGKGMEYQVYWATDTKPDGAAIVTVTIPNLKGELNKFAMLWILEGKEWQIIKESFDP